MSSAAIRNCIFAALLVAVPATAEIFYNKDGVVFEVTLRRVVSNASVCNVLEENHTPEEYERLKGNQGQPVHLWRVDYTVRNESGRPLEYLRASSWVRSERPPCTNWSGEGPGGGSVLPEPSLLIPMYWGDYDQLLQMPYGMRPGQQVRRAYYLEVFHEDQPRFGEWEIDYTFATDAATDVGSAKRGGDRLDRQAGSSKAAGQLPPEIQVDLNLRKAEQAVRDGAAATAREAMERLEALEQEHGLEPSPEDHFRYAQAWAAAGEPQRAMAAAVSYLQAEGRDAEHYTEALDLINREGEMEAPSAAGTAAASRAGPGEAAGAPMVEPAQLQPGELRVFDGIEFVWVPAGEFRMGSTSAEAFDDEQPVTRVRISRGFWLGKYEVTQAEWRAVMGSNPSWFDECGPNCPVERVSWDDVQEFIRRLNATVGERLYRLPTEAEWEYAARAGTSGDSYGNVEVIAWYRDNSGRRTHPVGQKAPNAWGLYDILGNVFEWVEDWHGDYPGGSVTDPRGPGSGSYRVARGGSWLSNSNARNCRAANRATIPPGFRDYVAGFRLLRTE